MSYFSDLDYQIYKLVKDKRSLAENDPLNLTKFKIGKIVFESMNNDKEKFINYVWNILDLTE